eukprot:18090_1
MSSSTLESLTYWAFLKSNNRRAQESAAINLREFIENQKREMVALEWSRFCLECYQKVFDLTSSSKTQDRIGGILFMDQLTEMQTEENELKIGKFCSYLKMIIKQSTTTSSIQLTSSYQLYSRSPKAASDTLTTNKYNTKSNKSIDLLELATQVLGHLTKAAGPLSTEMVEDLINNYIVELLSSKHENMRLAAVWIIRELTINVPTLINIHLNKVIMELHPAICDNKVMVRLGAIDALRECLNLIIRRPQAYRQQFEKIYNKAVTDLNSGASAQSSNKHKLSMAAHAPNLDINHIHGSLLTFGELLKGGEYMADKFPAICKITLSFRKHKDKFVRNAVIELLPKLASYSPSLFVQYGHLKTSCVYLMDCLLSNNDKFKQNKDICYYSLGKLSLSVERKIRPYLGDIVKLIKDGLLGYQATNQSKISIFHAALHCLSNLVCAVGSDLNPYLKPLIGQMFVCGLSNDLVETLKNICNNIEALQQPIHEQLALEIWNILSMSSDQPLFDLINDMNNKTYKFGHRDKLDYGMNGRYGYGVNDDGKGNDDDSSAKANNARNISQRMRSITSSKEKLKRESVHTSKYRRGSKAVRPNEKSNKNKDDRLIHLALRALGDFELDDVFLLPFIREIASIYLNYDEILVRKQAALTCCKLLSRLLLSVKKKKENKNVPHTSQTLHIEWEYRMKSMVVSDVLERLLSVAITDPSSEIRTTLLSSFNSEFDHYLSKNDSLETLFIALNDEVFGVQQVVLCILGRLAKRNPGQVMPNLRQTLIQLLTQLQFSRDVTIKCNSAELLGTFIDSVQSLVKPYVGAISGVLLPKLDESEDITLQTKLLSSIGKLSKIAGISMKPYLAQLLPIILKFLSDKFSQKRREVALISLSQLIQNTLYVVEPYNEHKNLLSTILSSLESTQSWSIRKEAMRTLGIIGALDPFQHKLNERASIKEKNKVEANRQTQQSAAEAQSDDKDAYYPSIALSALVLMLDDNGLTQYHSEVLRVIISILYRLPSSHLPSFLPLIIPSFLSNMNRTKEDQLKKQFIQDLSTLISIAKSNIKPYLDGIFELIHYYWNHSLNYYHQFEDELLKLIRCISYALGDEFKVYLTDLIPLLLNVLQTDKSDKRKSTLKVLHVLQTFGSNLEDHLFLVIPPLMKLCEQQDLNVRVRRECIKSITHLCRSVNFSAYSSRVIHPLIRIIDEQDEELRNQASLALCALLIQMGSDYAIFIPTIDKILKKHKFTNEAYKNLVDKLIRNDMRIDSIIHSMDQEYRNNTISPSHHSTNSLNVSGFGSRFLHLSAMRGGRSSTNVAESVQPIPEAPRDDHKYQGGYDYDDDMHGLMIGAASDDQVTLQPGGLGKVVQRWDPEQAYTKDDWIEWLKSLQVELLKQSPNAALRLCAPLAQKHYPLSAQLFSGGFLSCWSELEDFLQDELIRCISTAFHGALRNPGSVPNEVLLTLLNLMEFMDRQGEALPVIEQNLGAVAEISHSYAKALYYKEKEFRLDAKTTIAPLMTIYNRLQQQEAAEGIVVFAQNRQNVQINAAWYEKLNKWQDALDAYERSQLEEPNNIALKLGRMRCLAALGNWQRLHRLAKHAWKNEIPAANNAVDNKNTTKMEYDFDNKQLIASLGAVASWHLEKWKDMQNFVNRIDENHADGCFYRAILLTHDGNKASALQFIDRTRETLDTELTALVGESYNRAYKLCVRAQQLVELEEILIIKEAQQANDGQIDYKQERLLYDMWDKRLSGCESSVDVWQEILQVRSLIRKPRQDINTYLKFSSLCRKNQRLTLSLDVLSKLMMNTVGNFTPQQLLYKIRCGHFDQIFDEKVSARRNPDNARISISIAKHCWAAGLESEAIDCLNYIIDSALDDVDDDVFCTIKSDAFIKLGEWMKQTQDVHCSKDNYFVDNDEIIERSIGCFEKATQLNEETYWGWHDLALMHYEAINFAEQVRETTKRHKSMSVVKEEKEMHINLDTHIVSAVNAFFKSIAIYNNKLGAGGALEATKLQDILRLLHLWFNHGHKPFVSSALMDGFNSVIVDTWLDVIPQIIARLQNAQKDIASLIQTLLIKVGNTHPQALVYALAVASKSMKTVQKSASSNKDVIQFVLDKMREHSPLLVEQAFLVSQELIRSAILWDEMWYEALEEASRTYFGNKDPESMFEHLQPLHKMMMSQEAQTFNEISFDQNYGRDLAEAHEWCCRYRKTDNESDLNQAWEFYAHVFRDINKNLANLNYLELQYVSPALENASALELAVPGTYLNGSADDTISIERFIPTLKVMESKQRPRRLGIIGSNGIEYTFLLKGHEDLRLDERVMQLFGLVNTLLSNNSETKKRDLFIRGYAIIPLSPTTGILEWVPNCDTIHGLIKDYRESKKIVVNIENRLLLQMSNDFAELPLMKKVEIFEYALRNTTGQDLTKMLWLKSANAEIWLEKRTEYTRSLAVMSMVGYILGLGDRHPSNFMLDRFTGKLIHIDFGDCFEVAMQRDKFPEKFPFRLTRMLVEAMEISGIEGNFRITCQLVMALIRQHKESIQAVLEAFAYDPLINWRLGIAEEHANGAGGGVTANDNNNEAANQNYVGTLRDHGAAAAGMKHNHDFAQQAISGTIQSKTFISRLVGVGHSNDSNSDLNEKALNVLKRISQKLKGRDFYDAVEKKYTVNEQVQKLILQATSHENLAQAYLGWCPLW